MSASEKLKTLDTQLEIDGGYASDEMLTLIVALPQIVAVVEAAEAECADKENTPKKHRGGVAYWSQQQDHPIPGVQRRIDIARALAALDEALGEESEVIKGMLGYIDDKQMRRNP